MTTALAPSLFKMHDGVNGINTSLQSNTSSSSSSSQEENGMLNRHQNDNTHVTDLSCNQNDDECMQEGKSIHDNKGKQKVLVRNFYASTNLNLSLSLSLLRLFLTIPLNFSFHFFQETYQSFI